VCGVWGVGCGRCGGVGSLLTFDIPQTALVATLDTYDFLSFYHVYLRKVTQVQGTLYLGCCIILLMLKGHFWK
jgi:hypothetical protein